MKANALEEEFEVVTVCNIPMLFTSSRVDRATIPQGLYAYDVRHSDDDWGKPVEISTHVWVNHFGTLLSKNKLPLQSDGENVFLEINPETDWGYEGNYCSIDEFLEGLN